MASKKKNKKRTALRILVICGALILLAIIASVVVSVLQNSSITVARYTVASDRVNSGFRIVLLSDLHRKKFDDTNQTIVDLTAGQEPDLILLDGDMIDGDCTEVERDELISLVERLSAIAPVYYSMGNHDCRLYSESVEFAGHECVGIEGRSEFLERLEAAGAVFLESEYRDIEVNGDRVRLGGFYPFAFRYEYDTDEGWEKRREFLEEFCDTGDFRLMLSHRPDSFVYEGEVHELDIDLVLSGHTHNGVIATPFTHRAIWTSEGFFPPYAYGEHDLGGMKLIVTSGFYGWRFIPRVFNPPEIAVIDIVPEV